MNAPENSRNGERDGRPDQLIIVMRHGERRDGALGAAAETDPPLTKEAAGHVAAVAARLHSVMKSSKVKNLLLLVSPFQRTLETAHYLQEYDVGSAREYIVDNTLCEVFGPLRVKSSDPPVLSASVLKNSTGNLPEWGESMESAALRYVRSFYVNSERYHEHDLLFVTHGDAISAVLRSFYPMRTVYETDYLSFLMFKKTTPKLESVKQLPYELVDFNGVQWIIEGPEDLEEGPCVKEPDSPIRVNVSRGEEVPCNKVPSLLNSSLSAQVGEGTHAPQDTLPIMERGVYFDGRRMVREESLDMSTAVFRIGVVLSQMLLVLSWQRTCDAVLYAFVVAVVEAPFFLANTQMCISKCANIYGFIRKVEMLDINIVVKCVFKILPFNGSRSTNLVHLIIKQFLATSVKALAVFILSCALALLLSVLCHFNFHMIECYASFFTVCGNFCIFALFWVFNVMRGCHEEIKRLRCT